MLTLILGLPMTTLATLCAAMEAENRLSRIHEVKQQRTCRLFTPHGLRWKFEFTERIIHSSKGCIKICLERALLNGADS